MNCNDCNAVVSGSAEIIKCKDCNNVAHTECLMKSRNGDRRKLNKWKCSDCSKTKQKDENLSGGDDTGDENGGDKNPWKILTEMNRKLQKLDKLDDIEKSMEHINAQYEDMRTENARLKNLVENVSKDVTELKNSIKKKDVVISELSNRVNELEQANLNMTIEIHNVEKKPDEKLDVILDRIAQNIQAPDVKTSIEDCYRMPVNTRNARKANLPPIIVVKFKSTQARRVWLDRTKTSQLTSGVANNDNNNNNIRVYEMLTPYNRKLLWQTKTAGKECNYKYIWAKNGKIFAKEADNQGTLRIQNENDILNKIRCQDVVY